MINFLDSNQEFQEYISMHKHCSGNVVITILGPNSQNLTTNLSKT